MSPGDSTVLFRALPLALKPSREDQSLLKAFAAMLSKAVADGRTFHCLITNDRALRKLNAQFLGHDYATDVLSFPSGNAYGDDRNLGDLAISVERANAQALKFGHSCLQEISILMLHGLLHLTGLDHEADRREMARAEQRWRTHFGLPSSLIARARPGLAS